MRGQFNSSLTRVRPFFQKLFKIDNTGKSWLTKLFPALDITNQSLLPYLTETRDYSDKVLQSYGIDSIKLEKCFEFSLPPTKRFLKWLLEHPQQLTQQSIISKNQTTKRNRMNLFSHDSDTRNESIALGLKELDTIGPEKSGRKWWAFEGFTEVDCYLETEKYLILIEGKRTESLSSATLWYPLRNQLVRNLEIAREIGRLKGKNYGVLVLSENPLSLDLSKELSNGLPHFNKIERDELQKHYLGNLTWQQACYATGIEFNSLPTTLRDIL